MPKATWNNAVIAESDLCEVVENNQYFPPDKVRHETLRDSDHHTICSWKGTCSYFDVVVDGVVNKNAAWYYPDPKPAAMNIKNYVAFWKGVNVEA